MKAFILAAAAAIGLGSVSAAHAAATVTGSVNFTPDVTIDFEQAAENASLDSFYASSGVTFTHLSETYGYAYGFPPDLAGGVAKNFGINGAADFTIDFSAPQADAAFAIVTDSSATISTYLGGNLVESVGYVGGWHPGADIVEFTNSKFDSIRFSGTGKDLALIDNLAFAAPAVPEPATWAMLILGVAMVGFAARSRGHGAALA